MDETYKMQLLEQGAIIIILGLPEGTEFGIDMQVWNIGSKFTGIKFIPPGLHFIYFSIVSKYGETAPRTGFFHYFEAKEILVKKYDPSEEDIIHEEDEKTVERVKLNLKEIGRGTGPFPLESWTRWVSLTQHINREHLQRLIPKTGKICSAPELINEDNKGQYDISDTELSKTKEIEDLTQESSEESSASKRDRSTAKPNTSISKFEPFTSKPGLKPTLPSMIVRPGTEIRFSKFPAKPHKEGASPSEISRGNIDFSYTLKFLFEQLDSPSSILSEIQFSFVCFLAGHAWDSWEHWRKLVTALCAAEDTLIENPSLYIEFLSILHYQIQERIDFQKSKQEVTDMKKRANNPSFKQDKKIFLAYIESLPKVPEDLFVDIVESKNFLVMSLRTLFANIFDNTPSLPPKLISKATRFRRHLISKFKWSLELEEDEEELPVVVET